MNNMPGLHEMMQQFQQMQQKMQQAKAELAKKTVSASAGGGMVKATANGEGKLVAIEIEKEVLDGGDQEMLQDLVVAAVNQAMESSKRMAAEAGVGGPGGMDLGGLQDLFGNLFGGGGG